MQALSFAHHSKHIVIKRNQLCKFMLQKPTTTQALICTQVPSCPKFGTATGHNFELLSGTVSGEPHKSVYVHCSWEYPKSMMIIPHMFARME